MSELTRYLPPESLATAGRVTQGSVQNSVSLVRHHRAVRGRVLAVVGVVSLASAVAVVALASPTANGLPSYTNGYAKWPRVNKKPFASTGPLSSAHVGLKNVYASKRKVGNRYPNGTVIVKTIQKGGTAGKPEQVAVMRKSSGKWRYDEYELSGSRYARLDYTQQLCQGCHMQARGNDYVFTRR
jgi:hypothetical protein